MSAHSSSTGESQHSSEWGNEQYRGDSEEVEGQLLYDDMDQSGLPHPPRSGDAQNDTPSQEAEEDAEYVPQGSHQPAEQPEQAQVGTFGQDAGQDVEYDSEGLYQPDEQPEQAQFETSGQYPEQTADNAPQGTQQPGHQDSECLSPVETTASGEAASRARAARDPWRQRPYSHRWTGYGPYTEEAAEYTRERAADPERAEWAAQNPLLNQKSLNTGFYNRSWIHGDVARYYEHVSEGRAPPPDVGEPELTSGQIMYGEKKDRRQPNWTMFRDVDWNKPATQDPSMKTLHLFFVSQANALSSHNVLTETASDAQGESTAPDTSAIKSATAGGFTYHRSQHFATRATVTSSLAKNNTNPATSENFSR